MSNKLNTNGNVRQSSVRKKTASRICAVQVLYSSLFGCSSLQNKVEDFLCFYQNYILSELEIKNIDLELFYEILTNVEKHKKTIDNIISDNLSNKWKFERLNFIELCVLRLSVYEMCISKQFKVKTIINEYISIFDVFSGDVSFANAILDRISKLKINTIS